MTDLTQAQLKRLEKMLRERQVMLRQEIRAALASSSIERHRELAGMVHDAGDDSVADLLTDVNLQGLDRDGRELTEVAAALQRIQRGTYGVCIDCGRDIGYPRLEAQPTAMRCIEDETRREQQHGSGRGGSL